MNTNTTFTKLEQISTEKQRIVTRIAKLQVELDELEAFERVMARYGNQLGNIRRGRPQKVAVAEPSMPATKPTTQGKTAKATRAKAKTNGPPLGERVLALVAAAPAGIPRSQVLKMPGARANHIGMAIARHINKARIVERSGLLYLPAQELRPTG